MAGYETRSGARTPIPHQHRVATMSARPFVGCVALAGQCSPASHGTITRVQTCRCGATRQVNSDGLYGDERGSWVAGDGPTA